MTPNIFTELAMCVLITERYMERQMEENEQAEEDQGQGKVSFGDVKEEIILKTMTLQAVDSCINEVKSILEKSSQLLVSVDFVCVVCFSNKAHIVFDNNQ